MKEYNLTTKMRAYQWDELTDEQREVLAKRKRSTVTARTAVFM